MVELVLHGQAESYRTILQARCVPTRGYYSGEGRGRIPWGMGGWLSVGGSLTHFFACPITVDDIKLVGVAVGSADGQQT